MSAYAFNDDSAGDQLVSYYFSQNEFSQLDCGTFAKLEGKFGPAEATLSASGIGAFCSDELFEADHASASARLSP